jgi:hypothetical protein
MLHPLGHQILNPGQHNNTITLQNHHIQEAECLCKVERGRVTKGRRQKGKYSQAEGDK